GGSNGTDRAAPVKARRSSALSQRWRSTDFLRRPVGRLYGLDHRHKRGQEQLAHLAGRIRWPKRSPDHFQYRQREFAALESRWQVSLVHFVAARKGERQSGVAARSQWRRGLSTHRI